MDHHRTRALYTRQKSNTGTPGAPASPTMSPLNRHARMGSMGAQNPRKAQNAKAAAQRLAHVMAHHDDDEDEDDLLCDYGPVSGTGSIGLAGGRAMRSRSPLMVKLHKPHKICSFLFLPTIRFSLFFIGFE